VIGPEVAVPPSTVEGASAVCPAGTRAISGGGYGGISGIDVSEAETGRVDWFVITDNEKLITEHIHAEALCAPTGAAVAARALPRNYRGPQMLHLLSQLRQEKAAR
jgi:hypothetical protein